MRQQVDKVLGGLSRVTCLLDTACRAQSLHEAQRRCNESLDDVKAISAYVRKMKPKMVKAPPNVAAGRRGKSVVLAGRKEQTTQGLKKDDLMKNKKGKSVSKAASAAGQSKAVHIGEWIKAAQHLAPQTFHPSV